MDCASPGVLCWNGLAGQRLQELLKPLLLLDREVQWLDFLRPADKCPHRVTATIIEVDDVVECCGLPVAEVRGGPCDLTKAFGTPQAYRNCLAAEVAISCGSRIIAEMSVYVEVAIRDRWIADEGLVGRTPDLGRIGMRRKGRVNVQADDMEIVVRKQRGVMAVDAPRFTDKELKTLLRLVADCIAITRDVTVEWRIAAHEISKIRLDGLAVIEGQKKRVKSALARKRARKKRPRDGEPDRNPS